MKVFIESTNAITSLGFSVEENFNKMAGGISGVRIGQYPHLWDSEIPLSTVNDDQLNHHFSLINKSYPSPTKFEKLIFTSAALCLSKSKINPSGEDTLFILSTTKGNIELLKNDTFDKKINLWESAKELGKFFHNPNPVQTVSHACVSGLMAILHGQRLIKCGKYNNVVVVGADVLSKFIVAGFQSFHSLSSQICRPFDKDRDGLSLGEGAGTVVLTNNQDLLGEEKIEMVSGASSNDANHISGPSRTGEGLFLAIENTLSGQERQVDLISAHGTATPYNDDMESKAISRTGLSNVPVNSLKGYIGHTLGAAGIIESLINIESLKQNLSLKTYGLNILGVAEKITPILTPEKREYKTLLKLVSGFGGCNTAALFKKTN